MNRIPLVLLAVLGLSLPAGAQVNGAIQGFCAMGGVSALTQGLPSTNKLLGVIPSCTISVYLFGTTNLATIYSNATGSPLANPFTASALGSAAPGQWTFFAPNTALYTVVASGGIPPNTYVQPVTLLVGAGAGGGGSSPPQYSVQFALNGSGGFGSDPNITIDPVAHALKVAGSGTGMIGLGDSTTGNFVYQLPQAGTSNWNFAWPKTAPAGSYTGCMTATTAGVASWLGCGTVIQAAQFPTGTDIGQQVVNSLAACTSQCVVHIQSGAYSFSHQIVLPQNIFGQYKLTCDPGTILTWTGSGDAIVTKPVSIGDSNLTIEGCQVINSGSGSFAGIHLYPTNGITVQQNVVQGFHDGVLVEGTNSSAILNNNLTNNINGVRLISTFCTGVAPNYNCAPSNIGGQNFAANRIAISFNQITNNAQWGVIIGDSPGSGDSGALKDVIFDNDLEINGTSGSQFGAVYVGKSSGTTVSDNYFERSPRQIVLGLLGAGTYYGTVGARVQNNFFTSLPTTPFNIELQNANATTLDGNTEQGGPGLSTANCMINVGGVETNTVLLPNSIIQAPPFGNRLCIGGTGAQTFAGAGSFIIFNTNYNPVLVDGMLAIGNGTSDTASNGNVAANSSCYATAANNSNQSTAQGLIASVYVQPAAGSFTIFHPSGHVGLLYDVWCTRLQN